MTKNTGYEALLDNRGGNPFKILRILSLLPVLAWPLVFYMSIFFFDNPNASPAMVWALFIAANSYPLVLIGNLLLANKLYRKKKIAGYILMIWPIVLFSLTIVIWN